MSSFKIPCYSRVDRDPDQWVNSQGQGMDPTLLDGIVKRLVEVRLARPGRQVQLSESEIRQLCMVSRDIFLSQPNLLELEVPVKICGTWNVGCLAIIICIKYAGEDQIMLQFQKQFLFFSTSSIL